MMRGATGEEGGVKALGTALSVIIVLAIAGNPVVAFAVGILAGVFVWQLDELSARVRAIERSRGSAKAGQAPSVDEVTPPAPSPEGSQNAHPESLRRLEVACG